MNRKYFTYLLKSKKYLILFLGMIQLLAFICSNLIEGLSVNSVLLGFGVSFAILMLGTFVLPPIFFAFVHNKKSVDTYYSLAISRKELWFTTIAFLVCILFGTWLLPNVLSALLGLSVDLDPTWIFAYVPAILLVIISMCLFHSFLFLLANNTLDGVVLIGAYTLMPLFVAIALSFFQWYYIVGYEPINVQNVLWFSPAALSFNLFFEMVGPFVGRDYTYFLLPVTHLDILALVIFGAITGVLQYRSFVKRKVECAEQNSDHIFAYPFVIYFYTFILIFIFGAVFGIQNNTENFLTQLFSNTLVYLFVFIFFMVAHFVYRRKIYINLRMISFFLVAVLFSFGFTQLAIGTKGFGLSQLYQKEHEVVEYSSYMPVEDEKDLAALEDYIMTYATEEEREAFEEAKKYAYMMISVSGIIKDDGSGTYDAVYEIFDRKREEVIAQRYKPQEYNGGFRGYLWVHEYHEGEYEIVLNNPDIIHPYADYYYSFDEGYTHEELEILNQYLDVNFEVKGNKIPYDAVYKKK